MQNRIIRMNYVRVKKKKLSMLDVINRQWIIVTVKDTAEIQQK